MAKPMKQGPTSSLREEHQDADHEEQLHRDQQQADAHAGAQRDAQRGQRVALQGGEGGAGVGHGVDADAEPGHAVGAEDAQHGGGQNDQHMALASCAARKPK
jgi:hypothetical protein